MLKYLYDSASGLGDVIAPTPENLAPDVKNRLLYEASYENDVHATYDLIFVGASPCALNEVGNAAIHVAAREGNLKIVKIFVEANRQCINLRGRGGYTALHYAASAKYITETHFEVIKFLLGCGADGLVKNDKSKSAYDVCSKHGKYANQIKDTLEKCLLGYCTWLNAPSSEDDNIQKEKVNGEENRPDLFNFDIQEYKKKSVEVMAGKMMVTPPKTKLHKTSNETRKTTERAGPIPTIRSPSSSLDYAIHSDSKNNYKLGAAQNSKDTAFFGGIGSKFPKSFLDSGDFDSQEDEEVEQEEEFLVDFDEEQVEKNTSKKSFSVVVDGESYVIDDIDPLMLEGDEFDMLYDDDLIENGEKTVVAEATPRVDPVAPHSDTSINDTNVEVGNFVQPRSGESTGKILSINKKDIMKKISNVANQIGATTVNPVQQKSRAQDHLYLDAKINLKEVTNGLGVQFDQFLRVVAFRPGRKPTVLEDCGISVGDLLYEINGNEVHPPLHQALALLKESTNSSENSNSDLVLRFIRK